jgi:hypothetical protein
VKPGSYIVVRDYSHTDRQHLLKIESVPFKDWNAATDWKEWLEKENPRHKYAVIQVMDTTS